MEKISTLMRQGNRYPQIYNRYFTANEDFSEITGVCAVGALLINHTTDVDEIYGNGAKNWMTVLNELGLKFTFVEHPTTRCQETLWSVITDLNDRLKWSIAQIADWLESAGY